MNKRIPIKLIIFINTLVLMMCMAAYAQEPKIFKVEDFDLKGKVKSCLVLTDYGKEEFAFDSLGYLTKWVTRYNDTDYDITHYRYRNGALKERRDERYRDGVFDKQTSIAHFYVLDTVRDPVLTETIISYNQDLLDQFQYIYDLDGKLSRIIRTNEQEVDETTITYSTYRDEKTVKYELNGTLEKSIREKKLITKQGDTLNTMLEKEFVDGIGIKAREKKWDIQGRLLEEQQFVFNQDKDSFEPTTLIKYTYNDRGVIVKETSTAGEITTEKEYIYQFDMEEGGNWVKKITTPDNSYITRKITYYPLVEKTSIED